MKKQSKFSGFGLSVALSATFLLPSLGLGEYDDYSSSLNDLSKDTSKVEGVLGGALSSGSENSLAKAFKKAQEAIKPRKDLAEEQEKRFNWSQKNDKLKNLLALPDVLMQKALDRRQSDLKEADASLAALGKKNNFVNPQDYSMNGMPNSCRKNVDFTQLMTLTEQLGSKDFQYVQTEATKLIETQQEDLKKEQAKNLAKAFRDFKARANKDDDSDEIVKLAEKNKSPKGTEAILARTKASNKAAKEENKELKNDLVDVYEKFVTDLSKLEKNDKRVHTLAAEFANSLENSQRAAMMTAQQNVDQLYANCENEIKLLKTEIENFKAHLIQRGWNPQVAEMDTQAQRLRVANMQCTDVTQNVQSLLMGFGTDLPGKLSQVRAEKDPVKMLSTAVSAMQDVANIQMQVGQQLRPLMEDCEQAGLGREGLKERFAQLGGASGGAQAVGSNISPTGNAGSWNSRRSGGIGAASHLGNRLGN